MTSASSTAAVAANKRLAVRFLELVAAHDIDETWRNADDLGRLLQLGAKIVAWLPSLVRFAPVA